jgi:hypothetical protein
LATGFIIFSFSVFGGIQALGILISSALLVAFLTDIIMLPWLLLIVENKEDMPAAHVRNLN